MKKCLNRLSPFLKLRLVPKIYLKRKQNVQNNRIVLRSRAPLNLQIKKKELRKKSEDEGVRRQESILKRKTHLKIL